MKKIISLSAIIVLFIAVSLNLSSCNNTHGKQEIKIGATLDFTGPNAVYGKQVQQGINLALDQINAKGGIDGKKIKVFYLDSKSEPKLAVANAQNFISLKGIKIIIGEISSNATLAMIPVIEKNNAFLFAPASSSPKLTNVSKNFARNWPSDNAEAGSAAEYAKNQLKAKTASIIYVNSDYGIGLKNKFEVQFKDEDNSVLITEPYEVGATDFKTLLLKVKAKKADCIYLAGNPKEMGRCIKQLRESNIIVPVISNTGFLQNDCLSIAGVAADGVIVPTPAYDPKNGTNKDMTNFYKIFKQKYGEEPTMINANAYDAIIIITAAIKKYGLDIDKIAPYIRNLKNFHGSEGNVNFVNGDVSVPIIFKVIKNGKATTN